MQIQLSPRDDDKQTWDILRDGALTGDFVYERDDAPGMYFLVLNTSTLNAMGGEMPYRSFDDIMSQLNFYYANCV